MRGKYFILTSLFIVLFVSVNIVLLKKSDNIDRTLLISEPIAAKEKTLKKTFGTDGVIKPSSIINVYVEKDKGEIQSVLVEEGQYIEEGTPLVEYRNESAQAEIVTLEQTNEELNLEKGKLLEDRAVLEAELSEAESLPDIAGEEDDDKHVHPSYDQTRPIQYEMNNIDYSIKQIELKQANNQAKIDQLKEVSSETMIESELAGVVTKVHDNRRSDGDPIVTIASSNPLWAETHVDEEYIQKVQVGQSVLLYPEFLKANRIYGTILNVGAYPEERGTSEGQSVYPVTIEIEEEAAEESNSAEDPLVEDPTDDQQTEEPVEPSDEVSEGGVTMSSDGTEKVAADFTRTSLRIGTHMNTIIILEELSGPTIREAAVKYNKAIVLENGTLKQQKVVIGLHADKQYVIKEGVKEEQLLLRKADLSVKTGTSYITMADWNSLTKKRMKQFTGKKFALLYLHGFLR